MKVIEATIAHAFYQKAGFVAYGTAFEKKFSK